MSNRAADEIQKSANEAAAMIRKHDREERQRKAAGAKITARIKRETLADVVRSGRRAGGAK